MKNSIDNLRGFYETGKTLSYEFRIKQLHTLKNAIKTHENDILEALNKDLGKSNLEAYMTEIGMLYDELNFAIKNLKKWMKPTAVKGTFSAFPSRGKIYHEPLGVVLVTSPWNYPIQLALTPVIPAIAGGNCVAIKPSRYTPNCSALLTKMISSCFDSSYIKVFEGDSKTNTLLLEQHFDHIFFTGSPRIGRIVMEAASKNLTPVTLELGGKNPCIIDKNINIQVSTDRIAWGKYLNAGQTCVAPDYLLIHNDIKDEFIESFKNSIKTIYSENPLNNENYPKIINERHFKRLTDLLNNEKILFGGKSDINKLKIEPTVVEITSRDCPLMQDEIFGPIMPVIYYSNIDEVISFIKQHQKSLALYVFTKDKNLENKVISSISYGGGCINDVIMHVSNPNAPFGGVGTSGMGAYHGKKGFTTLTHDKYVLKRPFAFDNTAFRYKASLNLIKKNYEINKKN